MSSLEPPPWQGKAKCALRYWQMPSFRCFSNPSLDPHAPLVCTNTLFIVLENVSMSIRADCPIPRGYVAGTQLLSHCHDHLDAMARGISRISFRRARNYSQAMWRERRSRGDFISLLAGYSTRDRGSEGVWAYRQGIARPLFCLCAAAVTHETCLML